MKPFLPSWSLKLLWDGDAEVGLCRTLLLLLAGLMVLVNCGEDSEKAGLSVPSGDIRGTIIDGDTGNPVVDASVRIGGKVALTDSNGEYTLKGIPFSDEVDIAVTAVNYEAYTGTISLDQEFSVFDVSLSSPLTQVLEFLDSTTRAIKALDPSRIPYIQSCLSKDYTAAGDLLTSVAVWAGVIPPNYDELPETMLNVIDKYSRLEFRLTDPQVEFVGDSASARMRFRIYAETKPPKPQKWNIVVDGRIDLRREDGIWKITYWKLVSDFLQFEWEPL
jgi:hypothetical protein